jgi:formylglycine-generating enzyme required for sulfatase activity
MKRKLFTALWACLALLTGPNALRAEDTPKDMVRIPEGEFIMGSPSETGFAPEHPAHRVYLDAFYIDKYPVTFEQYDKFCEATKRPKPGDEGWGRGQMPVINVNWDDANAYAKWAGKRLPTEAEYEKAARGGRTTEYFWGDKDLQADDYAWYSDNAGKTTHPVGQKKPNPYGLYDIIGNVAEWCSDWYGAGYYAVSPMKNPQGPAQGDGALSLSWRRVLRGGSWLVNPTNTRPAFRDGFTPDDGQNSTGFRCAKTP